TLCPLVSPEIAIGLEPPIEPWWTHEDTKTRLPSFQTRLASSPSADEPQGWQTSQSKTPRANRGHTHSSGLDLETKIFSPSGRGRTFFLTSLFIVLTERIQSCRARSPRRRENDSRRARR